MNGLFLLNKSLGLSSNRAMQQIKRLFKATKAGHTGSLDPLASGMLPICLGEATKFAQYLLDADKSYEVTGLLGVQTTTGDVEGDVLSQKEVPEITRETLESIIATFQGKIHQMPPMFSALKHQGQPLYRYALQGIDIQRESREVEISQIQLLDMEGPSFTIRVSCSKGTYMRTLVEDIGNRIGCGAHVTKLHRLSTAGFDASEMISLEELEKLLPEEQQKWILPMDVMVSQFPVMTLNEEETVRIAQGQILKLTQHYPENTYRLYTEAHEFFGLADCTSEQKLIANRICQFFAQKAIDKQI
ncbi:MAG: tRNA pseudouridine(55) synthase TruB [Gammaproteobacteria bacterium]|nr:tRNA pseudouridine(55) synthase TruB [Gammaproteobacteria bacterium]